MIKRFKLAQVLRQFLCLLIGLHVAGDGYGTETAVPPPPGAVTLAEMKRLSEEEIHSSVVHETFAAYVLQGSDRTLVLDFVNVRTQARMLGRIVLFVERHGTPKTRIMTVAEVQKWLTQNGTRLELLTAGNNLRASEIARFFNTAHYQGEPLTLDEQRLHDWLLQMKVLRDSANGVMASEPEAILLSIPQASQVAGCDACTISMAQRKAILEHELAHARFTSDMPYQHYALWFWSHGMDLVTRSKFMHFLRTRGYDTGNRELMANEMQAFLMHTHDPAMFNAKAIDLTDAQLQDVRRAFSSGLTSRRPASAKQPYQFD